MTDKARIALAEAMSLPCICHKNPSKCKTHGRGFQPFTDANDDYAVLKWARKPITGFHGGQWAAFVTELKRGKEASLPDYKLGDYARAACKVLEMDTAQEKQE